MTDRAGESPDAGPKPEVERRCRACAATILRYDFCDDCWRLLARGLQWRIMDLFVRGKPDPYEELVAQATQLIKRHLE